MAERREKETRIGRQVKRVFTYEEACALLPQAQSLTQKAVEEVDSLLNLETVEDEVEIPDELAEDYQRVVSNWAHSILDLGIEVKGLWLLDFDSGSGYYCWRYPEPSLQYFHGYEDGFTGRIKLN